MMTIYLTSDKYTALADWILSRYGYEVPCDFKMPDDIKFLPDNLPPKPVSPTAAYYADGGVYWQDRWLLTEIITPAPSRFSLPRPMP